MLQRGATPAEWKVLSFLDETGQPISLRLSAGVHRLRLSTLERRANLGYILLIPESAGQ
ncbi:MAG: hypothetical protein HPY44_06880 [Armatimonadetes bacterium]|nr:hypothetical protein [Armatimonadota bacterium]